MSLEKIIDQINIDTKKEIDQILKEARLESDKIIKDTFVKADQIAKEILSNGEKKSENIKKIIISKEKQTAKKRLTHTKEEVIDLCFDRAYLKFKEYSLNKYEKLINKFIKEGIKTTGMDSKVKISKEIDRKIAKQFGLKIIGKTRSIGGIILISNDENLTLDYTIEGIIKREKNRIRILIGKILFS